MTTKSINPKSRAAKKAWETRRNQVITASQVIDALVNGNNNATRLLNAYVKTQVDNGKNENQVRAAIKSHVTRRTQ